MDLDSPQSPSINLMHLKVVAEIKMVWSGSGGCLYDISHISPLDF